MTETAGTSTKTEVEPMRIFISYGHPESEICKRIYDALKDRGHDPWYDEHDIEFNDLWRDKIRRGVERSQKVIACLSPHSTREQSVCLDELNIAIGVTGELGGRVLSILLAPESEVRPPAVICHRQWLDMSDWKEQRKNERIFNDWFGSKMAELFKVLESRENMEFVGEITSLRKYLRPRFETGTSKSLLKKEYVERDWLERQLGEWINDKNGERVCWLYGRPGVGKSAFTVHYAHYNPCVAAFLSCSDNMENYNKPASVVRTLSYLIACRIPEYRKSLLDHIKEAPYIISDDHDDQNVKELFEELISRPLSVSIDGGHETCVIVLDGLDECGDPEKNTLARTLYTYKDTLPSWLRIMLVSRDVPAVRNYMHSAYMLEISSTSEDNLKDIEAYICSKLEPVFGSEKLLEKIPVCGEYIPRSELLVRKSAGIFLYAEMACEIVLGKKSLDCIDSFPTGLKPAFESWCDWAFGGIDNYKSRYRDIMACILAAQESNGCPSLTESELIRILGCKKADIKEFARRAGTRLEQRTSDKHPLTERTEILYRVDHKYFRDWLTADDTNPFYTPVEDGLDIIAEHFYKVYSNEPEELTSYEAFFIFIFLYYCENVPDHLWKITQNAVYIRKLLHAAMRAEKYGKYYTAADIYHRCAHSIAAELPGYESVFCGHAMIEPFREESGLEYTRDPYRDSLDCVDKIKKSGSREEDTELRKYLTNSIFRLSQASYKKKALENYCTLYSVKRKLPDPGKLTADDIISSSPDDALPVSVGTGSGNRRFYHAAYCDSIDTDAGYLITVCSWLYNLADADADRCSYTVGGSFSKNGQEAGYICHDVINWEPYDNKREFPLLERIISMLRPGDEIVTNIIDDEGWSLNSRIIQIHTLMDFLLRIRKKRAAIYLYRDIYFDFSDGHNGCRIFDEFLEMYNNRSEHAECTGNRGIQDKTDPGMKLPDETSVRSGTMEKIFTCAAKTEIVSKSDRYYYFRLTENTTEPETEKFLKFYISNEEAKGSHIPQFDGIHDCSQIIENINWELCTTGTVGEKLKNIFSMATGIEGDCEIIMPSLRHMSPNVFDLSWLLFDIHIELPDVVTYGFTLCYFEKNTLQFLATELARAAKEEHKNNNADSPEA